MDFNSPVPITELSKLVGGKIIGDSNSMVLGLNELHVVRAGDITFVDHPKYYNKVLNSAATYILINKEVDPPEGKSLILHDNPFDAFNTIISNYKPFMPAASSICSSAVIGKGTVVQPGVFLGNNVTIGKDCIIHSNVSIYDGSIIGDNVIIHSNSVIGADAYYFQKRESGFVKFRSAGKAIIGNNVEIGALCSIDKGVTGDTIIGEGTKMDNHCQIGHDTVIGKHCLIGAFAAIAGVTVIEDEVILWARVAINKDIVIGRKAIILATSAVDKSIEGGKTYMGSPAMEVRQYWKYFASLRKVPELVKKFNL